MVADDWVVSDSARDEHNPVGTRLMPNLSSGELATTVMPDLVSNGFKHRSDNEKTNLLSATYIYMAFAEMPFKYANAR